MLVILVAMVVSGHVVVHVGPGVKTAVIVAVEGVVETLVQVHVVMIAQTTV